MNVKRFFAPSAREALRALKAELGADAIVLSNRAVTGGVEIMALPPGAIDTLHAPQPARSPKASPEAPRGAKQTNEMPANRGEYGGFGSNGNGADYGDDFHVTLSSLAAGAVPRDLASTSSLRREGVPPRQPEIRPFTPPRIETTASARRNLAAMTQRPTEKTTEKAALRGEGNESVHALKEANIRLMDELSGMRGVIERELAAFSWHETRTNAPVKAEMLGQLLSAGFSVTLARQLVEGIGKEATSGAASDILRTALDRRLKNCVSADEIIDRGGIYALIGPTGVGKTTTVAKLAARFVTRQGAGHLALITTDGYRIGAQEQLRIYGRILGVPVFAVRDATELRQTLLNLRGKRLVLIDTMGMNQRDRMVVTQASMLAGAGEVRRLLLLNATCRGDTLDDVLKAFAGPFIAGCILTKVDEAASIAPALDVAMRYELNVRYITNGQRVPEDMHLPDRAYLLQSILRPQTNESHWRFGGDETGAMLRAQGA
ncbi:MAG: flagellar biosynthesis protein FlhF [Azoarcus sp.]|jgi:flagellar biosynthesis protein FlhF|nr:flagellar biosynthesis protein FlhF [Azoarcus sp.]